MFTGEPAFRALRPEDAAPLLAMWNESAPHDLLTPGLLDEKTGQDPGFEPELALLCEANGSIVAFGMAVVRETGEGQRGVVKLLAVARGFRRRGIGGKLLERLERRLRERGADTVRLCESPPNYLCPGVDERYAMAAPFFERRGYRPVGTAFNMTADLAALALDTRQQERGLAGAGIDCRRMTVSDREAVDRLLQAHWPSWRDEVAAGLARSPTSVHAAIRAGEALGFAAWDTNNRGSGWFGPMGTAPDAQGLGIGRVLLQRCLRDMRAAGHLHAEIPWVEPRGFYEKYAGAAVSRRFNRYEKVLAP